MPLKEQKYEAFELLGGKEMLKKVSKILLVKDMKFVNYFKRYNNSY